MKSADNLLNIIKDLINAELDKRDKVVLCEVAAKNEDGYYYDVYVVPDTKTVIHNIPNQTRYDPQVGDYVYVYKVENDFNNSFICFVKK